MAYSLITFGTDRGINVDVTGLTVTIPAAAAPGDLFVIAVATFGSWASTGLLKTGGAFLSNIRREFLSSLGGTDYAGDFYYGTIPNCAERGATVLLKARSSVAVTEMALIWALFANVDSLNASGTNQAEDTSAPFGTTLTTTAPATIADGLVLDTWIRFDNNIVISGYSTGTEIAQVTTEGLTVSSARDAQIALTYFTGSGSDAARTASATAASSPADITISAAYNVGTVPRYPCGWRLGSV